MTYKDKPPIDELYHYGVKRRSGRYPWGSGEDPYQHSGDFLSRVNELKKSGMSEPDIAKTLGILNKDGKPSTTKLRAQMSLAKDERRSIEVATAKDLRDKGYSLNEIAKKMGYNNDSSVRSLLNANAEARMNKAKQTAEFLKKMVDEKGMIEVGSGAELELNVSKEKLTQALYMLELEGYPHYVGGVPQVTNPGKQTNIKVLCPPGTPHKDIYQFDKVHSIRDYEQILTEDGTKPRKAFEYPSSLDSSRLYVRTAEEGGASRDGVIEIRRGVKDLSLGDSNYAQVRIMVDGTHYLKGMAMYSDNLPDGVDVVFNSNKPASKPKLEHLKPIKEDPNNPFGALIKERGGQTYYDDPNGKFTDPVTGKKQSLSPINKTREEGDWHEWSNELSAQFLSKQSMKLINKQLGLSLADKQAEFDEICSLNNPTVMKTQLKSFADDCDSAAVHLKAAAMPRQRYQVLLPIPSLKDNEVYAPNYNDGETVALIRYPHGGRFEIPLLKVNNKHKEAKSIIGDALDGIGINPKVAEQLSGADFDGDTALVIPSNNKEISAAPRFKELIDFDPKMQYAEKPGMKYMTKARTQMEMGIVSNLITDMTLKDASNDEIIKAVKHSMVVIDAEKHKLDYKQSEIDNDIATLKKRYQGHRDPDGTYHEGASTLISAARSKAVVPKRQGSAQIDPETGKVTWKTVQGKKATYIDKNGKERQRTQNSTKMAETDDAYTLSSGTPQENAYASYANSLKAMANEARKKMLATGKVAYNANAKVKYKEEVQSLDSKLRVAELNAPREKQAQLLANSTVKAKQQEYPDMDKKALKKEKQRALTEARIKVGAKRTVVEITDKEWEAIQAGAISENKLLKIINHADGGRIKELAMPRATTTLSTAKINKISAMRASGYSNAEIAESIGCSTSTVIKYLKGKK